jgi:hypothetical protein
LIKTAEPEQVLALARDVPSLEPSPASVAVLARALLRLGLPHESTILRERE